MSVATKNPFAILNDDDDDPEPAAPAPPPSTQPTRGQQKQRGGPASRAGKYYQRGGARPAAQKDSAAEEPVTDAPRKFEGARDGRGGRGARGGRGGPQRGGRRPFDKHSQTGKTDSDKKIHNSWGGDDANAELKTEQAANVDAAAEGADAWGAPAPADDAWATPTTNDAAWTAPQGDAQDAEKQTQDRPPREREQEEEDNTLTLEQYLQQKKELAAVPKLEVRKANEGADKDMWKDAVPLAKTEEEEAYFVGKTKSAPKARAKKEEKVYLEIDARFDRPERGGRGRGRGGDRGGDRGRGERARGRGGPRGGRFNPAVNVDDQTAFPSLS